MEAVYQLGNLRVVDLTKVLDPATESRRCHLIRYNTGGPIPDYHTALDLTSHLGTHCECPYHHFEDGKSVGDLPLTTFMGRAIYVNIDFLEPNAHISAADLDRACGDRIQEGDIVSLDAGVIYKGYQSDAARTVGVGQISDEAAQLIEVTRQSFFEGIKFAKEGCHLHEISNAIADYNEKHGYGVIRDLVGHGIGTKLHEDPEIPNFRQERRGIKLYEGMTLAIEPMVAMGDWKVRCLDDDWTMVTTDHSLTAHYENTVLVTKNGPEILSLVKE